MMEPQTRRERVLYRMAEIVAEKLANLTGDMSTGLILTVAEMQAEEDTPPRLPKNRVEFRLGESRVPRGDDGPMKERK